MDFVYYGKKVHTECNTTIGKILDVGFWILDNKKTLIFVQYQVSSIKARSDLHQSTINNQQFITATA